jgi:hypothetical protein
VTLVILAIVGIGDSDFAANGQPALPTFPGLGAYSDVFIKTCGKQGVSWNPKELPFIGCFGLSSNRSASGAIGEREITVTVDSNGEESCTVDGVAVVRTVGNKTNVQGVFFGCSGLHFCTEIKAFGSDCSATLDVISRNSDKSVYFSIARTPSGHGNVFVTNQENWDYEQTKRK